MIEIKNLSKTYQTGEVTVCALNDVSLTINDGEFVAIMGASGSGKSTLLHILGFLDRPNSGVYYLNGTNISNFLDDELAIVRNDIAGFVFQQFHLLPKMTALQNAELPLIYAGKRHLREKAMERLKDVGLGKRPDHHPNQLSGGEQQRVAIARALVNEPQIIFADEPTGNLDTKSEAEIIELLKTLHKFGKTIVMVTHEREVAEKAQRIIMMRDGKIISDTYQYAFSQKKNFDIQRIKKTSKNQEKWHKKTELFNGLSIIDHLRMAIYSTISHKLRSFLSILGILIGVAAVIAMLALGEGAKQSIAKAVASMGSNLLIIRPGSTSMHGISLEAGAVTRFTLEDIENLEKLPDAKKVSASITGHGQIVYANKNWSTQIQGTLPIYEEMHDSKPQFGRFFTNEEVQTRRRVALLGTTVTRELFGVNISPIGKTIKINKTNFLVIGVLPEKGANGFRDQDDIVIIPLSTAMYRLFGKIYLDNLEVEVDDAKNMEITQDQIQQDIIKRHHLTKDKEDSFQIRNMADIQKMMNSTTQTMTLLLGFVAAISLIVGGIGIMNIMLVSVTERTKEIGLRKAIGATKKDILMQFLIESVFLTFLGGLVGICLGVGSSWSISKFLGWATKVSTFSVLLSAIFSIAVGLFFGLWPARHAATLRPIEALRYE